MSAKGHENKAVESARYAQLTGLMEWLRTRRLTSENRVPHYARWVERFLRFRGSRPREVWQIHCGSSSGSWLPSYRDRTGISSRRERP